MAIRLTKGLIQFRSLNSVAYRPFGFHQMWSFKKSSEHFMKSSLRGSKYNSHFVRKYSVSNKYNVKNDQNFVKCFNRLYFKNRESLEIKIIDYLRNEKGHKHGSWPNKKCNKNDVCMRSFVIVPTIQIHPRSYYKSLSHIS